VNTSSSGFLVEDVLYLSKGYAGEDIVQTPVVFGYVGLFFLHFLLYHFVDVLLTGTSIRICKKFLDKKIRTYLIFVYNLKRHIYKD
jgi:hypothetical protein